MFLRSLQKLGDTRRKRFTLDGSAGAEEVLADKKGEDINKVGVEGDLLECQVINWDSVRDKIHESNSASLTGCAVRKLFEGLE